MDPRVDCYIPWILTFAIGFYDQWQQALWFEEGCIMLGRDLWRFLRFPAVTVKPMRY
ncbi:MAG: hypothetical protein LBD74_03295 [Spirochaetaceae bacterium]|nr:hypothetical protein [Spirochaetaceae bacterium]